MREIHLHKKLESETLHLPELKPLIGEQVEIVVRVSKSTGNSNVDRKRTLRGSVVDYIDPFEPAVSPDEWEANR